MNQQLNLNNHISYGIIVRNKIFNELIQFSFLKWTFG